MNTDPRRCVLCPTTDRDGNSRDPNWAHIDIETGVRWQTCQGHYARTERTLEVIPAQWALLDATPKPGNGQRVTGSTEQSLGVTIGVLDLIGPANTGTVHDPYRDQTGMVSIASILDSWVNDWIDLRDKSESRPLPTVTRLAEWLHDRLDWAAVHHPALNDFAGDMNRCAAALRAATGDYPAEPDHRDGIECPKCDRMSLFDTGDFIECIEDQYGCGKLLKPSEYAQWVELKGYFLRASTPCPDCGAEALAGAAKLDKVECLRAKNGCGYRMSWKQYTQHALQVHRPERAHWNAA